MSSAPDTQTQPLEAVQIALAATNPGTKPAERRMSTTQYKEWRKTQPDSSQYPSLSFILKKLGTWSDIMSDLGASTGSGAAKVTRSQAERVVSQAMKAMNSDVPKRQRGLTTTEYKEWRDSQPTPTDYPSLSAVEKFGWNAIVKAVGGVAVVSTRDKYSDADTDNALADALAASNGNTLSIAEYNVWRDSQRNSDKLPSVDAICGDGTWNDAVIAAGGTPILVGHLSDGNVIAAVQKWYAERDPSTPNNRNQYELWRSRQPDPQSFPSRNSMRLKDDPSGSWENVLEAANIETANLPLAA